MNTAMLNIIVTPHEGSYWWTFETASGAIAAGEAPDVRRALTAAMSDLVGMGEMADNPNDVNALEDEVNQTRADRDDAMKLNTELLAGLNTIAGLPDDKPGERGGLKRARHIAKATIAKAEGRS